MNDLITEQVGYTPVGFKTKSVLEEMVNTQTKALIRNVDKVQTFQQLEMMGQLICSPKFNNYALEEKVNILEEFAELRNIVNTFK